MTRSQWIILIGVVLLGGVVLSAAGYALLRAQPQTAVPTRPAAALDPATGAPGPTSLSPAASPTAPAASAASAAPIADPAACLAPSSFLLTGRVSGVLAGALLQVEVEGKTETVPLLGVDPAGTGGQAQALLRELALGQAVSLAGGGPADSAGRIPRYVLAGQVFLNYELVRRGAALPALYPPGQLCEQTLLDAERLARSEGLGYWALKGEPTPAASLVPLTTAQPACDCSRTYTCADFRTRAQAQACYDACGDYRNTTLDPDHNGFACETLP